MTGSPARHDPVAEGLRSTRQALQRARTAAEAGWPQRACDEIDAALLHAAEAWLRARGALPDFSRGAGSFIAQVDGSGAQWRVAWGRCRSEVAWIAHLDDPDDVGRHLHALLADAEAVCREIAADCTAVDP